MKRTLLLTTIASAALAASLAMSQAQTGGVGRAGVAAPGETAAPGVNSPAGAHEPGTGGSAKKGAASPGEPPDATPEGNPRPTRKAGKRCRARKNKSTRPSEAAGMKRTTRSSIPTPSVSSTSSRG
jgi:hypothetical protein